MSRRKLLLEEMGITPLWRLRAAVGPEAEPASIPAPEPETDVRDPVAERTAEELPDGSPPAVESVRGERANPAPPPADADDAGARRQRIMQMDWAALKGAVSQCVACPLHRTRTQTVFGVGDERADWLFVGEGPGAEEDARGEPFVGQAGRLLDSMLAAIKLARRHDVYIANVVKCRPPGNRNPEEREMSCCEPYLSRQIELIQPKLIVALGKVAANHLLQTDASIASLRGRVHRYRGTPLIVTYHPAYLLRSLQEKAKAWVDLCFARETMAAIREQRSAGS